MKALSLPAGFVASFFLAALAFLEAGEVPKLINYQGKLTNAVGAALPDGTYTLRFELFNQAAGGQLVWGETRANVPLVGGLFNILLGGAGATPVEGAAVNDLGFAFGDAERYLQTTIVSGPGGDMNQTLTPRQQLASVPFAVEAFNGVPPGTVVPFFGIVAPPGWEICAGQAVAREGKYERLFDVIGTSCGAPNAAQFNLPDLRGRFLRGADDPDGSGTAFASAGRDPDRNGRTVMQSGGASGNRVGSVQGHAFELHNHHNSTFAHKDHNHWLPFGMEQGGSSLYASNPNKWGSRVVQDGGLHITNASYGASGPRRESASGPPSAQASVSSEGGNETRPINAYCNYIIKY